MDVQPYRKSHKQVIYYISCCAKILATFYCLIPYDFICCQYAVLVLDECLMSCMKGENCIISSSVAFYKTIRCVSNISHHVPVFLDRVGCSQNH